MSYMDRKVFCITGADRESFLQNLITNDLSGLQGGLVWAALLTPQGKYLADFFLKSEDDALLLDVAAPLAPDLAKRLKMYRLRADVALEETDLAVTCGIGTPPSGALPDPRHPAMGWRHYGAPIPTEPVDWDALRVAHVIPESGIELVVGESYPLELGFERLHGVDFRKGCYVGQEVTARMKHKTELKKGLVRVRIEGAAPLGAAITAAEKPVGTLFTQSGGAALAWVRYDRAADSEMVANSATIRWDGAKP